VEVAIAVVVGCSSLHGGQHSILVHRPSSAISVASAARASSARAGSATGCGGGELERVEQNSRVAVGGGD
jgi:hypothetical protein